MLNQCDEMTNKLVLCSIGVDSNALSLVHFRGRICDESYIIIIIIKSSFEDKYGQQSHMTITYSICNTIN